MKLTRSTLTLLAAAGVLAISACGQSAEEYGPDEVTTVDALAALALTLEEIPDPYARFIRSPGIVQLCTAGTSYEVRVVKGREAEVGACEAFPIERVSQEGSFPYADVTISGTVYRANEVHLVHRAGEWFVFLEGAHDQSVSNEHFGVVFAVVGGDEPELVSRCAGQIQANDEDSYPLYQCIRQVIDTLNYALVKWAEDDSCVIDYSFCPTGAA